jgi:hypothetical protein
VYGEYNKRFGTIAVEKGFITAEQLYEAVEIQILEDLKGLKRRYIGQVLIGLGYTTTTQVDKVLESMSP